MKNDKKAGKVTAAPARVYEDFPKFKGVEITAQGLQLAEGRNLSENEVRVLLEHARATEKVSVWVQADAAAVTTEGTLRDLAEQLQMDYGTLRNRRSVAHAFELSRRRDKLSFEHHAAVASLEDKGQDELLDLAEREGLSVSDLRREVEKKKGRQKGQDVIPSCVENTVRWIAEEVIPNWPKWDAARQEKTRKVLRPLRDGIAPLCTEAAKETKDTSARPVATIGIDSKRGKPIAKK